ncbi:MAG: hypothetical protein IJE15_09330 [Bacteroidaceae bacterium]|nr:hypothetical protein [Bacteroidaceae bacterium]
MKTLRTLLLTVAACSLGSHAQAQLQHYTFDCKDNISTGSKRADSEEVVSPTNPKDVTVDYIINASYDNNDGTGWEGSAPGFDKTNNTHNAEFFNTNYNIYQELTGLPNGVYKLSVQGFYRVHEKITNAYNAWSEGGNPLHAKVYAITTENTTMITLPSICEYAQSTQLGEGNEVEATSGKWVPSNMLAAAAYFEKGYYNDNSMIIYVKDGKLTIGLRKDTYIYRDWTIFDNWKLTYYGEGADAFKEWASYYTTEQALDYASMENLHCEKALLDAYNALINKVNEGLTDEEAFAFPDDFNAAHAALKQSIEAYNALNLAIEEAEGVIGRFPEESVSDLNAYLTAFDEEKFTNGVMPTADVITATTRIYEFIGQAKEAVVVKGGDCTALIVNASYDNNDGTGWEGSAPGFDKTNNTHNAEFYNTNYNIYQELTGLPNGVYHLSVQGFYRAGTYGDAYNAWCEGEDTRLHAKVYAITGENTTMITLPSICKYAQSTKLGEGNEAKVATDMYVPDNMLAAAAYFKQGYYNDNSMIICVEDGTLTIGLRKETKINKDWTIFDNWKLTYYGTPTVYSEDEAISVVAGTTDVLLRRTLTEGFNTLVLPFALTSEQVKEAFGEGTKVYTLTGETLTGTDAYTLNFAEGEEIAANTPVILKGVTKAASTYMFSDVTIEAGTPTASTEHFEFVGVYESATVPEGAFFLKQASTELRRSAGTTAIKGLRAYIAPKKPVSTLSIALRGEGTTEIENSELKIENSVVIYDLQGRRVEKMEKGIYIVNGKKVIK